MVFVVAWKSANKQITYRDENGKTLIKRGGTRSWRNNNPGNIVAGAFSEDHGSIGDDGRMAVFPDERIGRHAVQALLAGKRYRDLSIRDAMYKYAPPSDNNDTDAYIAAICKAVGVSATTVIKSLSDDQLDAYVGAIKKHEGWNEGETIGIQGEAAPGSGIAESAGVDPRVRKLIELGSDTKRCQELRYAGKKAMIPIYGKVTAKNACAATLSVFMREAGFPFSKIEYGAGNLAKYIEKELGWRRIPVGSQQPGDVAVCRDDDPTPPGADHIFFVTSRVGNDEMLIVDNQESFAPHTRFASGYGGKTPVEYFLTLDSAPGGGQESASPFGGRENEIEIDETVVTVDQDTNDLVERFTEDGEPL